MGGELSGRSDPQRGQLVLHPRQAAGPASTAESLSKKGTEMCKPLGMNLRTGAIHQDKRDATCQWGRGKGCCRVTSQMVWAQEGNIVWLFLQSTTESIKCSELQGEFLIIFLNSKNIFFLEISDCSQRVTKLLSDNHLVQKPGVSTKRYSCFSDNQV